MNKKEEKEKKSAIGSSGRTAISVKTPNDVHAELAEIGAQTGFALAKLMLLGAGLLIEEVKKTGRVPVPEVKLSQKGEAA